MQFDIEENTTKGITCLRVVNTKQLFQEALDDLFSQRYLSQHKHKFGEFMFVFQINIQSKLWSLMKDNDEIVNFLKQFQIVSLLSPAVSHQLSDLGTASQQQLGMLFQKALREVLKNSADSYKLPFFESQRQGYGKYTMKKRSGGRYKQANCCKLGSMFQSWKQRKVAIFLKGIAYCNDKGEIRQFLSFGHGFRIQFGKPQTGLEFGLNIFANQRKLCLQCRNIRQFITFLFTLRKVSKQSCYMTLNRFNSFAPLRYASSVKYFIDGSDYFDSLAQSFGNATRSILITGWMLSPQFLLRRDRYQISLEDLLKQAASRGVVVNIILYYQTSFLSNGSQHAKDVLEKHKNIKVLRHPCGKLPTLWSHHGKLVIIDQNQAYVGGLDICYGRFDNQKHDLFPPAQQFPGLEHNNARINDQWDVKNHQELSIPRNEARLPWHDVAQIAKGDVVLDLAHHFFQMWNFIRYENKMKPEDSHAYSLFDTDVKSVFSHKNIPQSKVKSSETGIFKSIENSIGMIKTKGKSMLSGVKNKIVSEQRAQKKRKGQKFTSSQDYFGQYLKEVKSEIEHVQKKHKNTRGRNSASSRSSGRSGRSQKFSVLDIKGIQQAIQQDEVKQDKLQKTNSFVLCGQKKSDFFALEIDQDYLACLQKLKVKQCQEQDESPMLQIQSDDEGYGTCMDNWRHAHSEDRDQCQAVRSVGHWSIGCHPSNTQFSIHIAYLQLISQAKNYIYIQNQFFISSLADSATVKNQVADAIYLRIRKAINHNERFVVYVVLPLLPGLSGDLEAEECILLRKHMEWQYDTICRGDNSLIKRLLAHTSDPSQYIQFLGLRTHGRLDASSDPKTEIVYVHSKLMIVDDQMVLCGSANINDRSLLGSRDSELAVISRGEDFVQGKMNGEMVIVSQAAQELRVRLWKEHFGFSQEECADPLAESTWEAVALRAANNTLLFRKIFGCYPDDQITQRKHIQQKREKGRLDLYSQCSQQIKGHVVEFPLHFLQNEEVKCIATEKEFYIPTQCLI